MSLFVQRLTLTLVAHPPDDRYSPRRASITTPRSTLEVAPRDRTNVDPRSFDLPLERHRQRSGASIRVSLVPADANKSWMDRRVREVIHKGEHGVAQVSK